MRSIAYWSRDHKNSARFIIAACHIVLFVLACYMGRQIKEAGISIPALCFWFCAAVITIVFILFSSLYHSLSFYRKKILDSIVLISSFLMVIGVFNQDDINHFTSYNSLGGARLTKTIKSSEPKTATSLKEMKRQFKELKRALKAGGASAGGIALAFFTAILLGFVVLGMSCSLACNNEGALAVVVLLLGFTGVFFICRAIIKALPARKRVEKPSFSARPPDTYTN